jgi:hypothetical protein
MGESEVTSTTKVHPILPAVTAWWEGRYIFKISMSSKELLEMKKK